jgi:hypothetical protein
MLIVASLVDADAPLASARDTPAIPNAGKTFCRLLFEKRFDMAQADDLSVWRLPFLMSVRDELRRSGPRIQIAKAAITGDHVRATFFNRAVLAVPVHVTWPDVYHSTPGGIAIGSTGRSSEPHNRRKCGDSGGHFPKAFRHDEFLVTIGALAVHTIPNQVEAH